MARTGGAPDDGRRVIARNKKARHDFKVLDQWEAGLVLKGTEVKSVREGNIAFKDAFARLDDGEVWLHNLHIGSYDPGGRWNHDETRVRKLLLNRDEIRRLAGKVEEKGLTLVPLDLYFRRGRAKITLALCRGKKHHDRREELKRRTMDREAQRAMRGQD